MVTTGYSQTLYWGDETLYGSAAAIDRPIGLVQSVNPTETNNLIKIRTLGGTRDYSNIVPGTFEVSGSFDYYLQGAAFLRQAIGEDTAASATIDSGPTAHATTAFLHVMGSAASPATTEFPSFTLEFADTSDTGAAADTKNLNRLFTGARVNTLSLSASVDEPVMVSVDWQAQSVKKSTAAATAVTEATVDPYVFYQGAVYATSANITAYDALNSADKICEISSFDWSVNNNLEANWYVSGTCSAYQSLRGLKSLLPKGRDYESSINMHFSDKTMYERFLGAVGATEPQATLTDYTVVVDFVRSGSPSATNAPTDDWLRIVMPQTKFDEINIAGAPEDTVTQAVTLSVERSRIYVVDQEDSYKGAA